MASPTTPAGYAGHVTRVFGPPGTGKTTTLKEYVGELVRRNGPDGIRIASFSVTAARHIADELAKNGGARLPDAAVGTLHSHAFRACGHPRVALDPKVLADWNEGVPPELKITPSTRGSSNSSGGDTGSFGGDPEQAVTGDELLGASDRLRARLVPVEEWPENVRKFSRRWEAWKREAGALDFTGMITGALERARDGESMPGTPDFFIVDEAQDNTPLEFELELAWGALTQHLILAGDDDQAINGWRGADPGPLLTLHGPDVHDRMLTESHRVPESVRRVAERWVRKIRLRKDKNYSPRRDGDGGVVHGSAFRVNETLDSMELVERAQHDVETGRTVMILASCNYMLERLIANLRAQGMPFHNPYRPAEGRWNPLGAAEADGMSTAERIFRYTLPSEAAEAAGIGRLWTGEDVQAWMELVKPTNPGSGMVRTAKKLAALFPARDEIGEAEFRALFVGGDLPSDHPQAAFGDEQFDRVADQDLTWLSDNLLKARQAPAAYPLQIVRTIGPQALAERPRLVVGTIHSVKGAAADVVYLAPDISGAALRGLTAGTGTDEIVRLFYVGMTRAYRSLRLLAPVSARHISRDDLLPATLEVTG